MEAEKVREAGAETYRWDSTTQYDQAIARQKTRPNWCEGVDLGMWLFVGGIVALSGLVSYCELRGWAPWLVEMLRP